MRVLCSDLILGLPRRFTTRDDGVGCLASNILTPSLRAPRGNPKISSISSIFLILIIFLFFSAQSFALTPETHLPEPQEQRARELFLQIKCPVCAGQVIESSNTEIAFQLRKLVREKIAEGKSDEEIKSYLIAEYGEDILNSPNFNLANIWLWILPLIFMVGGVWLLRRIVKF